MSGPEGSQLFAEADDETLNTTGDMQAAYPAGDPLASDMNPINASEDAAFGTDGAIELTEEQAFEILRNEGMLNPDGTVKADAETPLDTEEHIDPDLADQAAQLVTEGKLDVEEAVEILASAANFSGIDPLAAQDAVNEAETYAVGAEQGADTLATEADILEHPAVQRAADDALKLHAANQITEAEMVEHVENAVTHVSGAMNKIAQMQDPLLDADSAMYEDIDALQTAGRAHRRRSRSRSRGRDSDSMYNTREALPTECHARGYDDDGDDYETIMPEGGYYNEYRGDDYDGDYYTSGPMSLPGPLGALASVIPGMSKTAETVPPPFSDISTLATLARAGGTMTMIKAILRQSASLSLVWAAKPPIDALIGHVVRMHAILEKDPQGKQILDTARKTVKAHFEDATKHLSPMHAAELLDLVTVLTTAMVLQQDLGFHSKGRMGGAAHGDAPITFDALFRAPVLDATAEQVSEFATQHGAIPTALQFEPMADGGGVTVTPYMMQKQLHEDVTMAARTAWQDKTQSYHLSTKAYLATAAALAAAGKSVIDMAAERERDPFGGPSPLSPMIATAAHIDAAGGIERLDPVFDALATEAAQNNKTVLETLAGVAGKGWRAATRPLNFGGVKPAVESRVADFASEHAPGFVRAYVMSAAGRKFDPTKDAAVPVRAIMLATGAAQPITYEALRDQLLRDPNVGRDMMQNVVDTLHTGTMIASAHLNTEGTLPMAADLLRGYDPARAGEHANKDVSSTLHVRKGMLWLPDEQRAVDLPYVVSVRMPAKPFGLYGPLDHKTNVVTQNDKPSAMTTGVALSKDGALMTFTTQNFPSGDGARYRGETRRVALHDHTGRMHTGTMFVGEHFDADRYTTSAVIEMH